VDGGEEGRVFGGLAFRGDLAPFLKDEIAVSYRSESRYDGHMDVRMWPVTASLWLAPTPLLYAGGGVGWYSVTYHYDQTPAGGFLMSEQTRQQFGVHLGGGLRVPLGPVAAVDLGGRYVMMHDQESRLVPETFNPDFWTASLGVGLRF
jgi:opacity protein-like surface antigen